MADFSTLIATLQATIKTNYNQEITGQILQDDLLAMVNTINQLKQDTLEGYGFYGAPLADGASVNVTQNTFFLVGPGTYTINGEANTIAGAGISVLVYDSVNDEVRVYSLFPYDTTPTAASKNAITSGAVHTALAAKQDKDADAVAGNVAVMDGNGNSVDGGVPLSALATKAEVAALAGEAGLAEAVIDTDGAGTEQEFTFRKSGGDGGAYYRKIKGKTIVVDAQLASNDAEAVETTGVNQWDEEVLDGYWDGSSGAYTPFAGQICSANLIPVLPDTDYYLHCGGSGYITSVFFDAKKNMLGYTWNVQNQIIRTASNCHYIGLNLESSYGTAYRYDVCLNLSNPAINGQYFPYWKRTLQLGLTTKEDTDGNVPFPNGLQSCPVAQDEATKEGGTIRVGTRAYQAGDESDANVITDGTNTNYALATPQTFTWKEPLNLGVKVDENGTERAIAPEGATAPSAPFVADTTYTMSVARMVEILKNL